MKAKQIYISTKVKGNIDKVWEYWIKPEHNTQ